MAATEGGDVFADYLSRRVDHHKTRLEKVNKYRKTDSSQLNQDQKNAIAEMDKSEGKHEEAQFLREKYESHREKRTEQVERLVTEAKAEGKAEAQAEFLRSLEVISTFLNAMSVQYTYGRADKMQSSRESYAFYQLFSKFYAGGKEGATAIKLFIEGANTAVCENGIPYSELRKHFQPSDSPSKESSKPPQAMRGPADKNPPTLWNTSKNRFTPTANSDSGPSSATTSYKSSNSAPNSASTPNPPPSNHHASGTPSIKEGGKSSSPWKTQSKQWNNGRKNQNHTPQESKQDAYKTNTKADAKVDGKVDTKADSKVDSKAEGKADSKADAKVDGKADAKQDPKLNGSKNSESKHGEGKQGDGKHGDGKHGDGKQTASKQIVSKQTASKQTELKQTEPKQDGAKPEDTSKQPDASTQTTGKQLPSKQAETKAATDAPSKKTGRKNSSPGQDNSNINNNNQIPKPNNPPVVNGNKERTKSTGSNRKPYAKKRQNRKNSTEEKS